MAISTRINGVYRETENEYTRICGVWRESNQYVRINGVWREVSGNKEISEADILGFRLVYVLNKDATHPKYPDLKYNPKIPYIADLAGDNVGIMDLTHKSMIFEFDRDEYKEEGIIRFDGTLYAVLTNGELINISSIVNDSYENKRLKDYQRTQNLTINMRGYMLYELYGRYMDGWNNFFTTEKFMMTDLQPSEYERRDVHLIHLEHFLPVPKREEYYTPVAMIGIARDMHSPEDNMIGSKGTIDHTLQEIYVNGVLKPFVIEVYE